jgi:hypothetical protein
MLQPVTHSWTRAIPTGLGFDPHAYRNSQRIRGMGSLGDQQTFQATQQGISAGVSAAGAGIAISSALATGSIVGLASGIGAAVVAAVALGVLIYKQFEGCGATCTQSTAIANQVAQLLDNNLESYLAQPVHYYSVQQAALHTFNQAWTLLTQNCNNPALGAAGQSCITDRQQGSCAYKTSPGGWSQGTYIRPGANGSGTACWNWFVGYHDPIANDPTVVPDPTGLSVSVNSDGSVSVSLPQASVVVGADGSLLSATSSESGASTSSSGAASSSPSSSELSGTISGVSTSASTFPVGALVIAGAVLALMMVTD